MDCPDKIPQSGTLAHCRSNTTSRCDRSSSRHHSHTRHSCHDYKDRHMFSYSQSHSHNHGYRSSSHHDSLGAVPDHSTDLHIVTTHATEAQAHTTTAVTCHITNLHPVEIFPKMTADLNHTNLTDNITNQPRGSSSSLQTMPWKNKDRKHKQVTIDNPLRIL